MSTITQDPFNILKNALDINKKQAYISSKNISNQQTEGYVREEGFVTEGSGRIEINIQQIIDRFQHNGLRNSNYNLETSKIYHDFFEELKTHIGSEKNTFSHSLNSFICSLDNSYNDNPNLKQDIISHLEKHITDINKNEKFLSDQNNTTLHNINTNIKSINSLLDDVLDIQKTIRKTHSNEETFNLLNKRQEKLFQLSSHIGFQIFEEENPELFTLRSNTGVLLLQHDACAKFSYQPGHTMGESGSVKVNMLDYESDVTEKILYDSGRFNAILQIKEQFLPSVHTQMSAYAQKLKDTINEIHCESATFNQKEFISQTTTKDNQTFTPETFFEIQKPIYFSTLNPNGYIKENFVLEIGTKQLSEIITELNNQDFLTASLNEENQLYIKLSDNYVDQNSNLGLTISSENDAIQSDSKTYGFVNFFGLNDVLTFKTQDSFALKIREDIQKNATLLGSSSLVNLEELSLTNPHLDTMGSSIFQKISQEIQNKQFSFDESYKIKSTYTTLKNYPVFLIDTYANLYQDSKNQKELEEHQYQHISESLYKKSGVNLETEKLHLAEIFTKQMFLHRTLKILNKMTDELFNI